MTQATSAVACHRRLLWSVTEKGDGFVDPFRPLEPDCGVIQFQQPLSAAELRQAGSLIADRPDVQLYVYGRASQDLDFLQYFPGLRRLQVALYELKDINGISRVASSLEDLIFAETKQTFSLGFLESMRALKKLFLVKHKKDLSVVGGLRRLTTLGLSGITLPDLSLLLALPALRHLSIFLGSTTNLDLLSRLPALEELSLMRISKLADLGVLGALEGLKTLRLDWMRNVKSLPSLHRLTRLEDVTLDTMKGLTDLTPVAAAPALRRLSIANMPQLTADNFECLRGHPRLAELWAYTGRAKVNAAVERLFPGIAR
jgi:internalin A